MKNTLDINIPEIHSYGEYRAVWSQVGKIKITCVEKNEECKHAVGDVFVFDSPYMKPDSICPALCHVLELYIWRVALGFPSWNDENHRIYKLHCPDPKGTVWTMEKIDE